MTIVEERLELVYERICNMQQEQEVSTTYAEYFTQCAAFLKLMKDTYEKVQRGYLQSASLDELRIMNKALYEDVLGEHYETSYANPAYACAKLGSEYGKMLSFLYTELRSMIPFVFEGRPKIVKALREEMHLNRREFCDYFSIPYRTVQDWEAGKRIMPEYVLRLME